MPGNHVLAIARRYVGDGLFALAALAALRDRCPDHRLVLVVGAEIGRLLRHSPVLADVWAAPTIPVLRPQAYARRLRQADFDAALTFTRSRRAVLLAAATDAPTRVGYVGTHLAWLLTDTVRGRRVFSPSMALDLVRAVDPSVRPRTYEGLLRLPDSELQAGRRLLTEAGLDPREPYVVIAPGGHGPDDPKCWPMARFADVAAALGRAGWQVIVTGGPRDGALRAEIRRRAPGAAELIGRTSLVHLAAILQGARLLIGNDSGPAHLAAALGCRVIAIFGPTDPRETGPQGTGHIIMQHALDCAPCHGRPTCRQRDCLLAIQPDAVAAEALRALGDSHRG